MLYRGGLYIASLSLSFSLLFFSFPLIWHHYDSKKRKIQRNDGYPNMLSMYIKFTKTKTQMNLISLSAPLKLSSWCIIRGQPIIKWRLNEKESLFALFFSRNIEKGKTHKIDSYSSIKTFHSYPSQFTLPHLSHQKIWKGAANNERYVDVSCHVNIPFFLKRSFVFCIRCYE
jgi:hypothetical protein